MVEPPHRQGAATGQCASRAGARWCCTGTPTGVAAPASASSGREDGAPAEEAGNEFTPPPLVRLPKPVPKPYRDCTGARRGGAQHATVDAENVLPCRWTRGHHPRRTACTGAAPAATLRRARRPPRPKPLGAAPWLCRESMALEQATCSDTINHVRSDMTSQARSRGACVPTTSSSTPACWPRRALSARTFTSTVALTRKRWTQVL